MLEPVFQNSTMYRRIETFTRTIRSWIHHSPLVPASNHPPLFFFSNLTPDSLEDSKQRSSWFCDKWVQNSSAIFTIIPKFVGRLGTIKLIPYIDSSVILQCNPNTRAKVRTPCGEKNIEQIKIKAKLVEGENRKYWLVSINSPPLQVLIHGLIIVRIEQNRI